LIEKRTPKADYKRIAEEYTQAFIEKF